VGDSFSDQQPEDSVSVAPLAISWLPMNGGFAFCTGCRRANPQQAMRALAHAAMAAWKAGPQRGVALQRFMPAKHGKPLPENPPDDWIAGDEMCNN
jgi:hypothetical protein